MSDDFRAHFDAARADLERQLGDARAQIGQAQQRINARSGRNLVGAIASGVFGGALLIASLFWVKDLFALFALIIVCFASVELATALRVGGYRVPRWAAVLGSAGALVATWAYQRPGLFWGVLAAIGLAIAARTIRQLLPTRTVIQLWAWDLAAIIFLHGYVTLLGATALLLNREPRGEWWVLCFIVLVALNDTGAYVAGLNWGRHKLAPRISPGKTWEGFTGGAVASLVGGVVVGVSVLHIGPWGGIALGAAICVSATVGDLAESLLKRELGIKDMSSWLPGHGGFLDRLDSILPSAAVTLLMYLSLTGAR